MQLDNLEVPCFNTTLMGVIRGVADFYGLTHSDAMLYGASGHAFLINIHEVLCPSGPYCWNPERFRALLCNLGLAVTDHGFFAPKNPPEARRKVEELLRGFLDNGVPCSLLNMENQLITGYDDTGFITTQPWAPHVDFPPAHLTFGTWQELGDEFHMNFFSFERCEPVEARAAMVAGLECAADMWRRPVQYTREPYGVGPRAYEKWLGAVAQGHGNSHGNWWNGTVWAECRARAADFLREVGDACPEAAADADGLADAYAGIAALLQRASDKELADEEKRVLLQQALEAEDKAMAEIEPLTTDLANRNG